MKWNLPAGSRSTVIAGVYLGRTLNAIVVTAIVCVLLAGLHSCDRVVHGIVNMNESGGVVLKLCQVCRKTIPIDSQIGDSCPHCHVVWNALIKKKNLSDKVIELATGAWVLSGVVIVFSSVYMIYVMFRSIFEPVPEDENIYVLVPGWSVALVCLLLVGLVGYLTIYHRITGSLATSKQAYHAIADSHRAAADDLVRSKLMGDLSLSDFRTVDPGYLFRNPETIVFSGWVQERVRGSEVAVGRVVVYYTPADGHCHADFQKPTPGKPMGTLKAHWDTDRFVLDEATGLLPNKQELKLRP
jgi:hypothetical protein